MLLYVGGAWCAFYVASSRSFDSLLLSKTRVGVDPVMDPSISTRRKISFEHLLYLITDKHRVTWHLRNTVSL